MRLDLLNEFWKRTEQERSFGAYKDSMRKTTPFCLDDDMATTVSLMLARASDETLLRYLQASRLPYDNVWIEASYEHAYAHQAPQSYAYGRPQRIAWLLTSSPNGTTEAMRVSSVVNTNTGEILASVYPLIHYWNPTRGVDHQAMFGAHYAHEDDLNVVEVHKAEAAANGDPAYQRLAWTDRPPAGSLHATPGAGALERRENENEAARASPLYGYNIVTMEGHSLAGLLNEGGNINFGATQVYHTAMRDQAGDLGFICAALALINEVPVDFVETRPRGSLRAGGRLRPFMRSSIVSLKVPATKRRIKEIDKTIRTAVEAAKRARHRVRGHYMTADKPPRAETLREEKRWETFFDENHGGRLRWRTWISDCWRGSAEVGYVEQFYEVVSARRKSGTSKKPVDNELDLPYVSSEFNMKGLA